MQRYVVGWKIQGETVSHTKVCDDWVDVLKIVLVERYLGPSAHYIVDNKGIYEFTTTNNKITFVIFREGTWPDA